MVADRVRGQAPIGEAREVRPFSAPNGDRRAHIHRGQRDRLGAQHDVDDELARRGHQRVQRARRVADAAHGEVLRTGRDVAKAIVPGAVAHRRAIEIAERHDRAGERHAALGVADGAAHRGLRQLRRQRDLRHDDPRSHGWNFVEGLAGNNREAALSSGSIVLPPRDHGDGDEGAAAHRSGAVHGQADVEPEGAAAELPGHEPQPGAQHFGVHELA